MDTTDTQKKLHSNKNGYVDTQEFMHNNATIVLITYLYTFIRTKKTAELTTAFNLWNTITNLAKEL